MSRSYKAPIVKDQVTKAKIQANRRLRHVPVGETIANGKSYRKYTNPWDISDFSFFADTPEEFAKYRRK